MLTAILKVIVIIFLVSSMIAFYKDEFDHAFEKGKDEGFRDGYDQGYSTGIDMGKKIASRVHTNLMEDDLK